MNLTIKNNFCLCIIAVSMFLFIDASILKADWKAGVAKVDITPTEEMWMAGYASRKTPSEGILQNLYAKALVIKDEAGNRMAMVTTDLVGIPRLLRENVAQQAAKKFQLKPEQLLLNASHTHCGPELRPEKSTIYQMDPARQAQCREYLKTLENKIVEAMEIAINDLSEVELVYSKGRAGFAMNRRYPVKSGGHRNSPYFDGPVQHEVPVLKVASKEGKIKGILFGYACHNTTTGIMQFNGDYAGFAQAEIEKAHPGSIALFMMGCGGDQNPYPRYKIEYAKHHGKTLALAVETALQDIEPLKLSGNVSSRLEEVAIRFGEIPTRDEFKKRLKNSNKYIRRHAKLMLEQIDQDGNIPAQYPYMVQVAQIGNELTMVALAGEVVIDYDHTLRKIIPSQNLWVAGYSNDVFGYVPSLRVLKEGGYEGGGAMIYSSLPGAFAEDVEEKILKKTSELYESIHGSR